MVSPWSENGNIVQFTKKDPEVNRLRLLIDVASGLEYLHRAGVIHGNLRGSNILISNYDPPRALLSDFCLTSTIFDPSSLTKVSINWTAPELLSVDNDGRGQSLASDIYALAMASYEVLTGTPPFASQQMSELACQVVLEGKRPPRPSNSEGLGITDEIWDLLELCWAKDASSRPVVNHVSHHLGLAVERWTADATEFLLASEAGVQELMYMESEKLQGVADELDKVLDRIGVSEDTRKYLECLQKLCSVLGLLPQSFALTGELEGIEREPFNGGGFSDVFKATYKGQTVVVKILKIDVVGDPNYTRMSLAKEVVGWKWFCHENIVNFIRSDSGQNPFDLLVDVTNGLQYLHDHDFVHGDLKGANILIDPGRRARLADFGCARVVGDSCSGGTQSGHGIGTVRWSAPECLCPEMFGFKKNSRSQLPSKSTDIYALGMTIFEVITRRRPFYHMSTDAVYMHIICGGRPDRPPVGFSDVLWGLLVQSWHDEHESMLPRRPPISLLRSQLEQDSGMWNSPIGSSGVTSIVADNSTPLSLSPIGNTDPGLQALLEQVQEFLGTRRPTTTVVAPTPAPVHRVPPGGSQDGDGVKTPTKGRGFRRFRDKSRLLLDKFNRANRGPITLSGGLEPEPEENAEIVGTRFAKLFS